jgi:hypothetical protein
MTQSARRRIVTSLIAAAFLATSFGVAEAASSAEPRVAKVSTKVAPKKQAKKSAKKQKRATKAKRV